MYIYIYNIMTTIKCVHSLWVVGSTFSPTNERSKLNLYNEEYAMQNMYNVALYLWCLCHFLWF
jgi:hypothetical protein